MRMETPRWEDYKKLIAMKARSYSASYGIELDELKSEGNLIFVKAIRCFDGKRGMFSTFLWRCLDNGLRSFCMKQKAQAPYILTETGELPDGQHNGHVHIKRGIFIRQRIEQLPEHSCAAINLYPHGLGLSGAEPPKVVRGSMLKYMREQGLSHIAAWQAMREIKTIFTEVL